MIAREGVPLLVAAGAVAATVQVLAGTLAAAPVWAIGGYLLWLFWERRPSVPADPRAVVSPVNGRVFAVRRDRDPWLDRPALWVRIRILAPGVIPLRSPTEGKIVELYARRGVFGEAQRECQAGESPDCYGIWVRTDEAEDVVYAVSSARPFSRARFDHAPGERIGQGKRIGFFYFASSADVLMPEATVARVEAGDTVAAGASVLGHFS